jgi:O-antigen/teichoic acid export membrane protein
MTTATISSDRRLAKTIGKNTLFGVLASAVQVATRFVMVPIVIYHLGLGGYGIWSIIMATAAYMRFGSAGLKSAFQKYVAEATGNRDFETASKLLSTGSISMLALSVAGLIPIAIYSQKLARASGVPPEFLISAAGSITLLAVIMVMANFGASFEAIVMGAHRIDLTRTFNIVTTIGEAVAIIALLHFGRGLFSMAITMAASELIYISCCFVASRRIVPEIQIKMSYFTTSVFRELIRFAGSYQLVNVLEVLYTMLLPVTILKFFGAEIAGVYAVATRLVIAVLMGQDALILPLLSGGTVVFATGSAERLARFFRKSFKITVAATLVPLAFVGAFGALLAFAWTGQASPEFGVAVGLTCLSSFFNSISRLQLVLYRASGNALHDNIRQAFRLGVLAVLAVLGRRIGFHGVLLGLVLAELIGVIYMFSAMTSVLSFFDPRKLIPDAMRLTGATAVMITVGIVAVMLPIPWGAGERAAALIKLGEVSLACLIASWPAVALTKSISTEEKRTVLDLLTPWKRAAALGNE